PGPGRERGAPRLCGHAPHGKQPFPHAGPDHARHRRRRAAARLGARCIQYPLPPALHRGHAVAAPAALPVVLCGRAPLYWTVMTLACLPPEEAITRLVECFENLQPATVAELGRLYAPDARFKDPFNEVQGVPAIEAIFQHMFG